MTTKTQSPLDAALELLAARTPGRTPEREAQRLGVDRERCDPRSIQNVIAELRSMKRSALSRRQDLPGEFTEIYRELLKLHNQNVATPGALVPRATLREGFAYGPDGRSVVVAEGWALDPWSPGGVSRKADP